MADSINCSFHAPCEQDNVSSTYKPPSSNVQPQYIEETLPILLTKYTILTLLILFGVVGNIIVVIVTAKRKAFNSSLDLFVKILAVADLGFLLLTTPAGVVRAELPFRWPMGEYACKYVYPMLDLFFGSSVWTIAAIAIERYRNIVCLARVHRRERHTKRSVKILVVLVWCFSFIFFCIPGYVSVRYLKDPSTCTVRWTNDSARTELLAFKIWMGFQVSLSYILPLGTVIWTYIVISRQLSRSSTFLMGVKGIISRKAAKNRRQVETVDNHDDHATLKSMNNGSFQQSQRSSVDNSRLAQNRRAKNILTPVAFLFAVSMFPVNVVRVTLIFWTDFNSQPYYRIIFFITIIFAVANSSLNPVVYCIVSREFRNAFKNLFFKTDRPRTRTDVNGGFEHRESTDRRSRTIEFSCSHLGNEDQQPVNRNSSRLFLACNTKL